MSGFGNLLSNLLRGMGGQDQTQEPSLSTLLMQMLGSSQLSNFGGLLAQLQNGGLNKEVASWLGNGGNMPVSPEQLRNALGGQNVNEMSQQSGLSADNFLDMLSKNLPGLIDGMSPNGQLQEPMPDKSSAGSLADQAGLKDIR
jgi:uncharacterized protein YidB (DUF937 family)